MTNTTIDQFMIDQVLSRHEGGSKSYHTRSLKGSRDIQHLQKKEEKIRLKIEEQKRRIQGIIDGIDYLIQAKKRQENESKKQKFVLLLGKGTLSINNKKEFLSLLSNEELIVLYYGVDLKSKTEKKKNKQRCIDDLGIMRFEAISRGMTLDHIDIQYHSLSEDVRDSALKLFGILL